MRHDNFTYTPRPYPFLSGHHFGTWGHMADVTIFAKFQECRFRGYGPPYGQKSPFSIDLAYRSYNTVNDNANMLQCDTKICFEMLIETQSL